jgi:penicillin-binding protein 1C
MIDRAVAVAAGRMRHWRMAAAALLALGSLAAAVRLWPRPPLASQIPSSLAVFDAQGRLLRLTAAQDQQYRLWTPLDEVAPEFLEALLLHEDRQFYFHPGVDPIALTRAAEATLSGGARQGGSTITMQLARLLYGINTRSAGGKLRQIALAVGLELRYSKRELLEAHVNLMPYGGNVQGVGAASLIYFGKPAAHLGLSEALTLVLVPQAPASRAPRESGVEPAALIAARRRLFREWRERHPDARGQEALIAVPLHYGAPRALPFEAPHFTEELLKTRGMGRVMRTTLDLRYQHLAERVLQGYVREQARLGVRNAAALLIDSRDMGVRAAVGSASFSDASIFGQVNGTLAKRSPGSALKPFIYALAIDQGLIHPLTILKDAPTSFGAYSPENFDGRFVGPISATDALIRSRNVPAVALSARLAQPSFYDFLRGAGVTELAPERHYGLALALGGGEVTLEETASLYAVLANRGVLKALRHRAEERADAGTRLLSEQASFMTLKMLEQNPRPDDASIESVGTIPVAWKTGTSWGFRDAWSAGIFGHYVLVVWVGNFDGTSNPAFVGIETAAPLFFRIVDAVRAADPEIGDMVLRPPPGVTRIAVCAASGDLPNAECPRTALTWFIPGKSPIRISELHRRVWIDTRTGAGACPPFDERYVRSEVYEFWPSDIERLFAEAGLPRRRAPLGAPCGADSTAGQAPHIQSPLANTTYTLRAAHAGAESIALNATADGAARSIYWFVDEAYVGTSGPDASLAWIPPSSGSFKVRAVDDRGRADSRELRIAVVP